MIPTRTLLCVTPLLLGVGVGVCRAEPKLVTPPAAAPVAAPAPIQRQSAQMLPYAGAVTTAGGATAGVRPVMPGAAAVPGVAAPNVVTAGGDTGTAMSRPPIDPAYLAGAAVLTKAEQ